MIRPFRDEVERYGHYSLAAESLYDHPFQWGSIRTGPDLARVGGKYSDEWHVQHLKDPRAVVPESIMPPYAFLADRDVEVARIADHLKTLRGVGVPYIADEIAAATADLTAQADPDADTTALLKRYAKAVRSIVPGPATPPAAAGRTCRAMVPTSTVEAARPAPFAPRWRRPQLNPAAAQAPPQFNNDLPRCGAYRRGMGRIGDCKDCVVRDHTLCSSLTDLELGALERLGRKLTLVAGDTLIWAGDDSLICANVRSGVLKLVASTASGREQIVGLMFAADFVGQPYVGQSAFNVTAVTDVELCVFARAPFEQVLRDHVRMERLLLQRTLAALDQARAQMLVLARSSAAEKVAGFLASMAIRAQSTGCRVSDDARLTFVLPLSRGQIADVLGLTIETVSRQMTRLRLDAVIALPGGRAITVIDSDALTSRAAAA